MQLWADLGFSKFDFLLLVLCPLGAILGGLARFIMLDTNFERLPGGGRWHPTMTAVARFKWVTSHVFISAVLGLVFALYFVGSIKEAPSSVTKLAAFAVLLGYAAPRLWASQEKMVMQVVERKLEQLLRHQDLGTGQGHNAVLSSGVDVQPHSRRS